MSGPVLRATLGALAGGFVGAVMALIVVSTSTDELGGIALFVVGLPIGIAIGVKVGAKSAVAGPSSRAYRRGAILAGLTFVLLMTLLTPPRVAGPTQERDADGCKIVAEEGESQDSLIIVVYDRYCPGVGGHSVNVSVIPNAVLAGGPGNVFVLQSNAVLDGELPVRGPYVFVTTPTPMHLVIQYDPRGKVVRQSSRVRGYDVAFHPDSVT